MTEKRYKATRPDGTDFYSGTIHYAEALESGKPIHHPDGKSGRSDAARYLSVATTPTNCTAAAWPCRLFEVETVDEWTPDADSLPNKRATLTLRVIAELDPTGTLGPQAAQIVKLIEQAKTLTYEQARRMAATWAATWDATGAAARGAAWAAARGAARGAAWDAAWDAARDAARGAAWDAAWDAARGAAWALVVRDLITAEQYDILAGPWESVMGKFE